MSARCIGVILVVVAMLAVGCRRDPAPTLTAEDIPRPRLDDVGAPIVETIVSAQRAVGETPDSAAAWGHLGVVFDAHGFTAEALVAYRHAEALDPDAARWPYLQGYAIATDDPAAASAHFERAVAADPDSALIRHTWGDTLLLLGDDEAAHREFTEALRLDPDARRAHLGLAELALRRDQLDEAEARLDRAAELMFYERGVHAMRARLYRSQGQRDRAARENLYTQAYPDIGAVPDPHRVLVDRAALGPKAHTKRGLALAAIGRHADAERAFRASLEQHPASVRNRLNVAGVMARQGREREAIDLLERLRAEVPDDPNVYNHLAVVLTDSGQPDAAMRHARTALELDPRHDEAAANLGRLHEQAGRVDEAIDAYRQAVALNPVNAGAHRALAALLDGRGRSDEALPHWRDAADFGGDDPATVLGYAMAAARAGQFRSALAVLRRALRRTPEDPSLLAASVTILATGPDADIRDGAEALRLAERLVRATSPSHVPSLNLLAAAQAEAGDFAAAIRTSEAALGHLRAKPDPPLARLVESRLARYRQGQPYHQRGSG